LVDFTAKDRIASSVADMLLHSILLLGRAVIAGRRAARTSPPRQLTIEDWQQELNSSGDDPEARGRIPATAGSSPAHQPTARELLDTSGALLTRTHLRERGLERRAVDAVFRALPVVALPGYSRPMIRAEEYRDLLADCTFREDRVRPTRGSLTATAKTATGRSGG
jgi:hypothetical protein